MSIKTGSKDVDSLGLTPVVSIKLGCQDVDYVGLADPAMTVNIGIKDIDSLGLTVPPGTALTVNVVNDHKTVARPLIKEVMKVSLNQAHRLHLLILLER